MPQGLCLLIQEEIKSRIKYVTQISIQILTTYFKMISQKNSSCHLTYINNLEVIHQDTDIQSIAPYQHRTHNSHLHQNCILHCWYHHCSSHFQSIQVDHCNSDLHSKYNLGTSQCLCQDHSNLHHQNYNWHYLSHQNNSHFQLARYVQVDNLHVKDTEQFILKEYFPKSS